MKRTATLLETLKPWAGLVSWQSMRGDERSAHRVIAIISVGSAALFCLAIFLPMVAALVLPPCFQ